MIISILLACNQEAPSSIEEAVDKKGELNIDEIEGIETTYKLTFEEVKTPKIPFEEFKVLNNEVIKEISFEKAINNYTFLVYNKKDHPEDSVHQNYLGVIIKEKDQLLYEIDEIAHGDYSTDITKVFNKEVIRFTGACGTYLCDYYIDTSNKLEPSVFLSVIHLGLYEIDINNDGSKDIISRAGNLSQARIYLEEDGKILESVLNQAIGNTSIWFEEDDHVFRVWFVGTDITAIYKYQDKKLQFVRFEDTAA